MELVLVAGIGLSAAVLVGHQIFKEFKGQCICCHSDKTRRTVQRDYIMKKGGLYGHH